MDFVYFIQWWAALTFIGLTTFIWLRPHLSILSDQGYILSKALGLLLVTYTSWILSSAHVAPYHWVTIVVIVAGVVGLAVWTSVGQRQASRGKRQEGAALDSGLQGNDSKGISLKGILLLEGLFIFLLAAWSLVRAYNPRIEGVEKFMNIAFINGALRTEWFPMVDPWFAGEAPNYYYFGHLMVATLTKLSQVPPAYAFNLAVATVFALSALLIASLVHSLTKSYLAAITSAFLAVLSSNLDPAINAIKQSKDYIFFSATRLDPYVINEFPLYSFIVADLHAHTINLLNVLSILTLLFVVYAAATTNQPPATTKIHFHKLIPGRRSLVIPILLALALGATAPTNAFDAVIYGALTALVLTHLAWRNTSWTWTTLWTGVTHTALIGLLAIVLYTPFYLHFQSPSGGLGIDLWKTPISHLLINFGLMLFLSLPLAIVCLPPLRQRLLQKAPKLQSTDYFAGLLLLAAIAFILFLEIGYIKDIYDIENPPYNRANSFFKIGYQVWILFSITAGYGLYLASRLRFSYKLNDLYIPAAGALLALSLVGTWAAFQSHQHGRTADVDYYTLDGYRYLQTENPDQLKLISWINQSIQGQPVTVEAAGDSYTQLSRISSYTGLPTIIGWASHQWGWRYSPTAWSETISPRIQTTQAIYTATDPQQLQKLLDHNHVDYLITSPVEADAYHLSDFYTIENLLGEPLFASGEYKIYSTK